MTTLMPARGANKMPAVSRAVGAAGGSTIALALLVCGCVFAALAGPALSLHTQTQALQESFARLSNITKTVQVSTTWDTFLNPNDSGGPSQQTLATGTLSLAGSELAQGFKALPLPLAGGQWAGLTTKLFVVKGAGPRSVAAAAPQLELSYREPLASYVQVTAGSMSDSTVPQGTVAVVATTAMAYRFGLKPGTRLQLTTVSGPVALLVTGIVREKSPGSTFWDQDTTVATPSINASGGRPYWVGGLFADPDELAPMQSLFSGAGLQLNWEFPLALGGVNANQAQGLYSALNRAETAAPRLTGSLQPSADGLTVTSPLIQPLTQFLTTQAGIETVLLLLFVSLIVVGAAVIILAARMLVARRADELSILRARGGSLRQVAVVMARTAVLAAVPATVAGAVLAVVLVPDAGLVSWLGWSLAAVAVVAALAGPPLIAAWQYRRAAPASNPALRTSADTGRTRRGGTRPGLATAWRRPVAEITACAASVGGLIVLHDQGLPAGGGIDLYLAITPVLVAIPVVLIMLRLYPLAVRGLLAVTVRGAGITGFVALSRAARSSLAGLLPAFALVLALSVATFAGMVSQGISRGEVAASWQTTGADVMINAGPNQPPVTSAVVKAVSAVRGVQTATPVWVTSWVNPGGQPVQVLAVDPASYEKLVASTPFAAFPAARIGTRIGATVGLDGTVSVLASPSAASILGTSATQLNSLYQMGPFKVRVAGTLASTPAQPGGGSFVVMPLDTLPGLSGAAAPNLILVSGSSIDDAQLTKVVNKLMPGNYTAFRSQVLHSLTSSPLQHGAAFVIDLSIAAAAAFGLFIVILGLALGSAERELTVARLTVMGHERPTGLVMAEAMPAVLAAIVAGVVCALALPHLIGAAIDLSAFTGTSASVQFTPDLVALGLPALAICVLAVITLVAQTRSLRRHGVTGMLRAN